MSCRSALERLHFVQNDEQPRMSAVAQHRQQALEEAERTEVVQLALDTGNSAYRGGDVGLAAQPGSEPLRRGDVAGRYGTAVPA